MQKKQATNKRKPAPATETSLSIQEQTEAFLSSGGSIQQIPKGVSGQTNFSGPRHIILGQK